MLKQGNIEKAAFEVISGCIKERNKEARESADRFIESHPNYRLNKHINRLCME